MRQQKPNSPLKQPIKTPLIEDDENRIDWMRKSLKKQQDDETEAVEEIETVDEVEEILEAAPKRQQKGKRDKRRHLVMDEESGRVFIKRRRKSNRYETWLEEYD